MIYGRFQKEGNLLVHSVFNIPPELDQEVTDKVFAENEYLKVAQLLECPPKYVRSLATSKYTTYTTTEPSVRGFRDEEITELYEKGSNRLLKDNLEDKLSVAAKDIKLGCEEYTRVLAEYQEQLQSFELSIKSQPVIPEALQESIAIGYQAVLLKRYLGYLESAIVHMARVIFQWTVPVEVKDEICQVREEMLDGEKFLREITSELSLQTS